MMGREDNGKDDPNTLPHHTCPLTQYTPIASMHQTVKPFPPPPTHGTPTQYKYMEGRGRRRCRRPVAMVTRRGMEGRGMEGVGVSRPHLLVVDLHEGKDHFAGQLRGQPPAQHMVHVVQQGHGVRKGQGDKGLLQLWGWDFLQSPQHVPGRWGGGGGG